jgi:hypothetical protein
MERSALPIFVVGSPRSGTSILTWCLGQHRNILPIEESNWMGKLAFDLIQCHGIGSARGNRSHLSSLGITADMLLEEVGLAINRLTLSGWRRLKEAYATAAMQSSDPIHQRFRVSRDASDPKLRWVDGTPEYSFYIWALLQLFPKAVFIHLVRDAKSVVRSMMHFTSTGGESIVEN